MEIPMKRSTFAAILFALTSTSAFADNDKGFYAGVGVGQFNVKVENISSSTFNGDDTVYKAFGGWRLNRFISVELDYVDLGSPSDKNVETKINGWAPYVIGTIPLGPIEIFGRLGYYFYNVDVTGSASAIAQSIDGGQSDVVYGAGFGITLFDHLNARLEYEEFNIKDTKESNAVWLSGAWRF
jgi:hypothetical protein